MSKFALPISSDFAVTGPPVEVFLDGVEFQVVSKESHYIAPDASNLNGFTAIGDSTAAASGLANLPHTESPLPNIDVVQVEAHHDSSLGLQNDKILSTQNCSRSTMNILQESGGVPATPRINFFSGLNMIVSSLARGVKLCVSQINTDSLMQMDSIIESRDSQILSNTAASTYAAQNEEVAFADVSAGGVVSTLAKYDQKLPHPKRFKDVDLDVKSSAPTLEDSKHSEDKVLNSKSKNYFDYADVSMSLALSSNKTRSRKYSGSDTLGGICLDCVKSLMSMPEAIPFNRPVDPERDGAPDYFLIISNPMDLRTIRDSLKSGSITNLQQFVKFVNQVWTNAYQYNSEISPICQQARYLSQVFDSELQGIEKLLMQAYPALSGGKLVLDQHDVEPIRATHTVSKAIDRREQDTRARLESQIRQLKESLKKLNQRVASLSGKKGVYQAMQHLQRTERQAVSKDDGSSNGKSVVQNSRRSSMPFNTSSMDWRQKFAVYKSLQWVSNNHHRYLQYMKQQQASKKVSTEAAATENNDGVELVNHIAPLVQIIEEEQPELLQGLSSEVVLDLDLTCRIFSRRIEQYMKENVSGVADILAREYTLQELQEEIAAHSGYHSESAVAEDEYFYEEEEEEDYSPLPTRMMDIELEDDTLAAASVNNGVQKFAVLHESSATPQKLKSHQVSDSSSEDSDDSDSSDTDSDVSFDQSHQQQQHSIIVPTSPVVKEFGAIIDKSWDMSDLDQQFCVPQTNENSAQVIDEIGGSEANTAFPASASSFNGVVDNNNSFAHATNASGDELWSNYRKISAIKNQMNKEKTELEERRRKEREEKDLIEKREEELLKAAANEESQRLKKEAEYKRGFELMQKREQERIIREQKKQQMLQDNN